MWWGLVSMVTRNDVTSSRWSRHFSTSSPGPSCCSKWRIGETLAKTAKYSKNPGVFCHVTHDEMAFSEVVSSVWRTCLFSVIGNRCSNVVSSLRDEVLTNFWSHFGSLGHGCLRSAILNKEKALATRLAIF